MILLRRFRSVNCSKFKNELEAIVYQTRSALDNVEMKSKLSEEKDIVTVETALNGVDNWLLEGEHSKSEYDNKNGCQLNGTLQPIMTKAYQQVPMGLNHKQSVPPNDS